MIPPSKIRKARKNLPIIVLILVVACLLFYAGLLTGTKCFGTVCKENQMHIVRSEKEINKEKENLFKSSKDEEILEHQNNLRFIQRKMFKEELAAPSTPLPSKLAQPKNMEYTSPILKFKSVLNSKEKNLQKSVSHILSSGNVIRQDQKTNFLKIMVGNEMTYLCIYKSENPILLLSEIFIAVELKLVTVAHFM